MKKKKTRLDILEMLNNFLDKIFELQEFLDGRSQFIWRQDAHIIKYLKIYCIINSVLHNAIEK